MKIFSWNILSARRDLTPLFARVLEADADVVAFQEVEWWAYQQFLKSPIVECYPHEGLVRREKRDVPGWLHIRSKKRIKRSWVVVFKSSQTGRGLLCCEFDDMVVATTHMESHPDATKLRLGQIDEIHEALKGHERAVVIGDLNFDGDPEHKAFIDKGWSDAAEAVDELTPTWDPTLNYLARLQGFAGESEPVRIDRAYVRGLKVKAFEVGADGPSDHRSILLRLGDNVTKAPRPAKKEATEGQSSSK